MKNKHKTLGQVYTPQWIVCQILDLLDYNNKSVLDKYILEPSSGDGVFLLEIVNRYIDICKNAEIENEEIIKRLEKYIYAVEIDEAEHAKSIQNLNHLAKEKLNTKNDICWNVHHANTLDFYKSHVNFFDYIVGNPPYIRIHNLDIKTREILKQDFLFSEGTIDIYLSFFEMGIRMLKGDGLLGFITPNSYLHNSSYALFRNYLKREKLVKILIDFKANKVFKGFSTYTAISIMSRNNTDNYFEYKELIENKIEKVNTISFDALSEKNWSFSNADDEKFLQELGENKNTCVKDFFDVQYGFATLRDKIFISKIRNHDDCLVFFNEELVEKKILKKVVKGSTFKGEIDENERILFPYEWQNEKYKVISEEKLKTEYPYAYSYLLKHKQDLTSRDLDKHALWYEFGRSQGVQTMHNEKIVLSTLVSEQVNYYKLPKDVMVYSGLFIIKNKPHSDWKIIEEILSSADFFRYIKLTGKDFSGGYKSITSKQIKEFKF